MIQFTEEQELLRKSIRAFVEKECSREYVRLCENERRPPWEAYKKLVELGWLGLNVPEKYGGSGGSIVDLTIMLEELGRGMLELALMVFRVAVHCVTAVLNYGTEEQREYFLPKVVKGELMFSFALTEPNTGADVSSLSCAAVPDGDYYIITGQKMFTTGMHIADWCLVATRTDSSGSPHYGITTFMVDAKSPGIEVRKLNTLGRRCVATCEVFFDEVKVPKKNMLGELNQGWKVIMGHLGMERLAAVAAFVGAAQAAFQEAVKYAKERIQFNQPIGKFQAISHKLAEMQTRLYLSRLILYDVALMLDKGKGPRMELAMMKLFCTETYKEIALNGIQILGAYGYTDEYDMERHVRESLVGTMGPGSSEIQKNIIAKELGL